MCLPRPVTKVFFKTLLTFFFFLSFIYPLIPHAAAYAATFNVGPNDTSGLINAFNDAISSGEPSEINLANNSEYLLTSKFSSLYSDNGLPLITGEITVNGNSSKIYRDTSAPRFRIFAIEAPGKLTLNNITLSNGESVDVINGSSNPNDISDYFGGGAILNFNGTLEINNSTITKNTVFVGGGAGIWAGDGSLTKIFNSTLSDNIGGGLNPNLSISSGGAFVKRGSGSFEVYDSIITNNYAKTIGGAIYSNQTGEIIIESTEFSNNSTENEGGAIFNYKGNISINNSNFFDNRATRIDAYGIGGAILNNYENSQIVGDISISNSHFTNNSATNNGGFLYNRGPASISNSCVYGNSNTALVNTGSNIPAQQNYWGGPNGPNQTGADTVSGSVDYSNWLSSCPPLASPSPKTPVVMVPGMGGSWNTEALLGGGTGGTWKKTPFVKVYDNLKNTFLNAGYEEGVNYFEWYYDWRRPVGELAGQLQEFIDTTVLTGPGTKVNLIGHSLGGVVSRAYGQLTAGEKLNQLVTAGSPHAGAIPAYLLWSGAQLKEGNNWETLGLDLYLHLHGKEYASPVTAVQNLSPSLKDLLPLFNFAKNSAGAEIPVGTMTAINDYLSTLSFNLFDTIAGQNQQTIEWLKLGNRSLTDRLLNRWPDGRPANYKYTANGDKTVLTKSALIDGADQISLDLNHQDLMQTETGIDAILESLGVGAVPQTGNEQPEFNPALFFLLHSPAEITVTAPGGGQAGFGIASPIPNAFYSPEDKLLLIYNALAGNYQTEITGSGDGQYQLDIGQLTENASIWSSLIDEINSGGNDLWQVNFVPDDPLADPVVDPTGQDKIAQARLRLEKLKGQTGDRLDRYLDLIIKLLDKPPSPKSLELALTSTYKFRFWLDRFHDSNPGFKDEADQIGRLLNQALVTIGQNSRQFSRQQAQKELNQARSAKNGVLWRAWWIKGENPALGQTLELIDEYFDRARQSFSAADFWQTHADALIARILAGEAHGLIR